jgi:hypothetical protein
MKRAHILPVGKSAWWSIADAFWRLIHYIALGKK